MGLPSAVPLLLLTPRRPQPLPTTESNSPFMSATRQEALPVPGPLSRSMQPLPPCKSPSRKSFSGATSATGPGSFVCLLGGTYSLPSPFSPPASGTPSSWIVYNAYGDSPVYIIYTGAPTGDSMISFQGGSFPSNPSYLE